MTGLRALFNYFSGHTVTVVACVAGGIRGHKGGGEAWNTACPKTKHFEFSGSWVTERSDWLEYRFEFMIDRKNTSGVYLRNWNQLVLILEVASFLNIFWLNDRRHWRKN